MDLKPKTFSYEYKYSLEYVLLEDDANLSTSYVALCIGKMQKSKHNYGFIHSFILSFFIYIT
jgi:hypothetical protein